MSQISKLLDRMKGERYRITKVRKAVIELMDKKAKPISVPEIGTELAKLKIKADKTTLYREIYFLRDRGLAKELQLGDNRKYYELVSDSHHHHHAVCINCEKIEDIEINKKLALEEKTVSKTNFIVTSHSLEFYGLCSACRK